jgi:hypothetical protein
MTLSTLAREVSGGEAGVPAPRARSSLEETIQWPNRYRNKPW